MSYRRFLAVSAAVCAAALLLVAGGASAQSASGTLTGRVLWGSCLRAIPLPLPQAASPGTQAQPAPVQPSASASGLPAGAVLVAVQNTSISARTDETGQFTLSGVPAGQYLTVAAGPVAEALTATAERPNVFLNAGQTLDIGTLSLGGGASQVGSLCRILPGAQAAPGTAQPSTSGAPSAGSTGP
ncbi:MAG: carboxypeptidase regulatory-like domain-containing protein [Acetobacteraceae bacterium]|nr:carboxypeptidase regulatory-like domain-containing protein [Acetobacteraceae bacterium]